MWRRAPGANPAAGELSKRRPKGRLLETTVLGGGKLSEEATSLVLRILEMLDESFVQVGGYHGGGAMQLTAASVRRSRHSP